MSEPPNPDPPRVANTLSGQASNNGVMAGTINGDVHLSWLTSAPTSGDLPAPDRDPSMGLISDVDECAAVRHLQVHRAISTPISRNRIAAASTVLPAWIARAHDAVLATIVAEAAEGTSVWVTLVGGSSTGKTRSCWEALRGLPAGWTLWHPVSPNGPAAVIDGLVHLRPKTVVWLDETQHYLLPPGHTEGEHVAGAVRELLRDRSRGPVLFLATVWPKTWQALTDLPDNGAADLHPHARALLHAHPMIRVPDAFTTKELRAVRAAARQDWRLAEAAECADRGEITQYLAGGPALVTRFETAPAAARALMCAAMDLRRMGHRDALPLRLLECAAPAYLSSVDADELGEGWLADAVRYVSRPVCGVHGPLIPITPSPPGEGALFRLADYLDDHYGRAAHTEVIPPVGLWTAAADHAHPEDMVALGDAADSRGLHRCAAQLWKTAAARGDAHAAFRVIRALDAVQPADERPAQWAVAVTALTDPHAVAELIALLDEMVMSDTVDALLARDPAAQVSLTEPGRVRTLLHTLCNLGTVWSIKVEEQLSTLLARGPGTHVALTDLNEVTDLLAELHAVGATAEVEALATRAVRAVALTAPQSVALLLSTLRTLVVIEPTRTLLARDPAGQADLGDSHVTGLIDELIKTGATDQAARLARQLVDELDLTNTRLVASAVRGLNAIDDKSWVSTLLARSPAVHVRLANPGEIADLVSALRTVGATGQLMTVAQRTCDELAVPYDAGMSELLACLADAGAPDALTALADHSVSTIDLADSILVKHLLDTLWALGLRDQVSALLARDPVRQVDLTDPVAIATLLSALSSVNATDHVRALTARDPAVTARLQSAVEIMLLLAKFREVGADDQVRLLVDRNPAREVALTDPISVNYLTRLLRSVGAEDHADEIIRRMPAAGMADLWLDASRARGPFRFGRDPDGQPAVPWTWDDLL